MRILSVEKPERKWGDGHVCRFRLIREEKKIEPKELEHIKGI